MTIVVGYLRTPEGHAALDRALDEAELRGAELVVVHTSKDDLEEVRSYDEELDALVERAAARGISVTPRDLVRDNSPAQDLLEVVAELDADLLVIGLRRRSPVGKLVLGSNSQDILLGADCPVLAVKATAGD